MLRVGLSGGIGSGKSTVARRLVERGAVLVDADQLAREVVRPGTDGLAALVERFGAGILDAEGALDRAALAARAFADDGARADLNAITHPRIGALTAQRMAEAPADAIVVHDIPLLVEAGYAANYHLVVIVDAPVPARLRRLADRGVAEQDALARIRAQATDKQRAEAADVLLDNSGPLDELTARVDALWDERLVPFERNVRARRCSAKRPLRLAPSDPSWPRQARRLIARLRQAAGDRAVRLDHIGSTAVPGLPAEDVIDLQLAVRSTADAEALVEPLAEAGFPAAFPGAVTDSHPFAPDPADHLHVAADPGRCAHLHVRVDGSPGWWDALLFPAWLRADDEARAEYAAVKAELVDRQATDPDHGGAAVAEEWFATALPRARAWAERTGWTP
ncbi:dephospho-CoA kinase [Saccharopolyspora sp. CA-218241]|uniref:dephospho-CoA kinase n=1 Tax=Saccharopolyspora sp. CA-218241 TaxID=3240027 RepID=UPI003D990DE7